MTGLPSALPLSYGGLTSHGARRSPARASTASVFAPWAIKDVRAGLDTGMDGFTRRVAFVMGRCQLPIHHHHLPRLSSDVHVATWNRRLITPKPIVRIT